MKIKKKHFDYMKETINYWLENHCNKELIEKYETGNFPNAYKTQNLQKRFCFDILYESGLNQFICDSIYPYANDDHIFTAIRKICPVVTKRFITKNENNKI